jgi:hypothetical protein
LLVIFACALAACGSSPGVESGSVDASVGDAAREATVSPVEAGPDSPQSLDADSGGDGAVEAGTDASALPDVPFCGRVLGAPNRYYARCCNAAEQARLAQGETLVSENVAWCKQFFGMAIARGRLVLDTSQEAQCYAYGDALANHACSAVQEPLDAIYRDEDPVRAACGGLYVGQGNVGAPCAVSDECKPGLTCLGYVFQAKDGTCAAPPGMGAACGPGMANGGTVTVNPLFGSHPECAQGYSCTDAHACAASAPDGGSCFFSSDCDPGEMCILGACRPHVPVGGGCGVDTDCQLPLYCTVPGDGGTGTCEPRQSAGATCPDNGACLGLCDLPDGAATGTCIAFCGAP